MKRFLKGRSGLAIELALYTLFAIFGFCLLLTTVSLLAVNTLKINLNQSFDKHRYDEVGEQFLYDVKYDTVTLGEIIVDGHIQSITRTEHTYSMTYAKNGEIKLAVDIYVKEEDIAAGTAADYIITRWNYGESERIVSS